MNQQFRRLLGALFAVALIASACGSQDTSASLTNAANNADETAEPETIEPESSADVVDQAVDAEPAATDDVAREATEPTNTAEPDVSNQHEQDTQPTSEPDASIEPPEIDDSTPEGVVVDAPDAITPDDVDVRITASVLDGVVTLEGEDRVEASVGDTVLIEVSGDSNELIHLHGFNIFQDLTPDTPAVIEFVPEAPGRFEIEVERTGAFIAELVVS